MHDGHTELSGNLLRNEMHIKIALEKTLDGFVALRIHFGKMLKGFSQMPDGR